MIGRRTSYPGDDMSMDARVAPFRNIARLILALALFAVVVPAARAQETLGNIPTDGKFDSSPTQAPPPVASSADAPSGSTALQLPDLTKKETFSSAMQMVILLTVLSLAPAILIMMTSVTRIVIVLSLLRQALGTQQLPPNQVLIGL